MSSSITGRFDTRRDADMAIERLVQEFAVERTDIFAVAAGDENSVGDGVAGSDAAGSGPGEDARDDGAHNGAVTVSVDINDDALASTIRAAIEEFGGAVAIGD